MQDQFHPDDLKPCMTFHDYIALLIKYQWVDQDIAQVFIRRYESIRYGPGILLEKEFVDFMKLFTLFLKR